MANDNEDQVTDVGRDQDKVGRLGLAFGVDRFGWVPLYSQL